jgi:Carboxypeptidase regulatory-like domain/TonB dependent receptor
LRRICTLVQHSTLVVFAGLLALLALPAPVPAQTLPANSGSIDGTVATQGGTIRLGGAAIVLRDAAGREVASILSEGDGRFRIADLAPATYVLAVSLDGFASVSSSVVVTAGSSTPVALDLAIAALATTIDVVAPASIVTSAETLGISEQIDGSEAERLSPGGGLEGALRLLASVIQVPGGVAIKGGRATQAGMQIGASTLADPGMGLVHLTLPVDAIDSVAVLSNPYAVEYGRFSSGLVVIQTRRAGDRWKVRLNNLDPTFRTKRHQELYTIKGIASFGPRLEIGGPIVKNRLFIEQAAQYRYTATDVPSRPEDELTKTQWFSSFTRLDANLSPTHSIVGMGSLFPSVSKNVGLGTFVPPDSTVTLHERVNHAVVTERALWSDRLVGESTVQLRGYRAEVAPLGPAPMQLFPDTHAGNFYNQQRRTPTTVQWIETLSGSTNGLGGLHLFKVGADVLHSAYNGSSASSPVLIRRQNGTLIRRLDFSGPSVQSVGSTDAAFFAQDRVQPTTRWYTEYGARIDRDGVLDRWNATPRVGTAVLLNEAGTQVVRGGFGLFYERTPSVAGAFGQFEAATESRFGPDGMTPAAPPITFSHVTAPDMRTARSRTWDMAYDYRWSPRWTFHLSGLDRRGSHELTVDAAPIGALILSSDGRSEYREVSAGFDYKRSTAAALHVTYTRSAARSDTNPFASYFEPMMWPIIGRNAYATAAIDVPNRLFARGHLQVTPTWLALGVFDWRTGAPYSVVDEALDFVGPRNVRRLPNRAKAELGIEHRFIGLKWKPWIGIRAYNAFDAFLPNDVQANLGSPSFGSFYNSEYRQLRLQLRFEP